MLDRVKGYFACLSRGEMPSMVANAEVLEQWRIDLADDGQDTHTMRYLPPDGQKELRIYTREDGRQLAGGRLRHDGQLPHLLHERRQR